MQRDVAIRLVRALVARRRNIAAQAGLGDQVDSTMDYALRHRWLATPTPGWRTLTAAGYAAAKP